MDAQEWIPQIGEEMWIDRVGWGVCEQRGKAKGAIWIWAGGVAYPLDACRPVDDIRTFPGMVEMYVGELAKAKNWAEVQRIVSVLPDSQYREIELACPPELVTRIWALYQERCPQQAHVPKPVPRPVRRPVRRDREAPAFPQQRTRN